LVAVVKAWQNLPANLRRELAAIFDGWVNLPGVPRAGIAAMAKSAKGVCKAAISCGGFPPKMSEAMVTAACPAAARVFRLPFCAFTGQFLTFFAKRRLWKSVAAYPASETRDGITHLSYPFENGGIDINARNSARFYCAVGSMRRS